MTTGAGPRWTRRSLYFHARTAGFVYQAVLRFELAQSVGLLFEEVSQGHADVAGVPAELRREFSGRRQQIVEAMERHGTVSAKGAQAAALDTCPAKEDRAPSPS